MSFKNIFAQLAALAFVASGSLGLTAALIVYPSHAGSFPGLGKVIQDTLPCVDPFGRNNCIYLQERVNIFQGLGKSKSALEYCRQKYGRDATVVWKLGLRWCATSSSM
jgi:hypothetical protein